MAQLASAYAPPPATLIGRLQLITATTAVFCAACALLNISALAILKGVSSLTELMGPTEPPSTRRPRRFLITPLAPKPWRRSACICGSSPDRSLTMIELGEISTAAKTTVSTLTLQRRSCCKVAKAKKKFQKTTCATGNTCPLAPTKRSKTGLGSQITRKRSELKPFP